MPPKKYVVPRAATDATTAAAQPKQRKQRAPPSKPPDMSNTDWRAEVQRREAVTTDRRNRTNAKKARDRAALAATAVAEQAERSAEQAEAARAGMMNPPGGHGPYASWSQQSVGSPSGFSSSPQPWGCRPSPGYADGDAHDGFNPNITFPHGHPAQRMPSPAFAGVQYLPYTYSPPAYAASPTPPLRRGALLFSQASSSHLSDTDATEADMNDIITTGSAAAAASPGFTAQDDTIDLNGDMDDELDYGEEEPEEEDEDEEETAPAPARKGKKKKKRAARTGEPRIKWASKEDECLDEAWKVICLDPTTGTTRASTRIGSASRSSSTSANSSTPTSKAFTCSAGRRQWRTIGGLIQTACNKWHGIVEEIAARLKSGASIKDQLVRMFAMFRQDSSNQHFKYLHVFKRIQKCEKWADTRRTLAKAKETYKPDTPTPGAADGRPDGNKGAKKGKHAESATARVQESIEHCIADAQTRAAQREEKTEARWSALMTNNAVKLDLLRTNVAAKKRNTDLAFLMGGVDMSAMDEQVKAWYLAERGLSLNQMPSTTAPTPTPTPTPPPSPSDDASTMPSTEAAPTLTSPRTPTPPTPEADTVV
ncbi:hypothetical protein VPH35_097910 [Triticum aestivum]